MKLRQSFLGTLAFAIALPLFAHHPFSSEYDQKKPLTLKGTVTNVDWKDPHVHMTLSVKNDAGKMEDWQLEAASPEYLTKQGMKASSFPKGQAITVNAYRATDNSRMASARVITTAAGKEMQVCDPSEDGGPAK